MEIDEKKILVKDLVEGYSEDTETGSVIGYAGKLNIRPKYQREFVYKDEQRNKVIDTVLKGFPLNVFYWCKNSDNDFEVLDGQQRTISICQYVHGDYSIKINSEEYYFHNLPPDLKDKILNYVLTVYWCSGTDSEKLEWFNIINIAGEKLTDQELRNAVYSGDWLTSAKKYFSHSRNASNCPAYQLGNKYLKGDVVRQEYLETVLKWISNDDIIGYMAKHQHDPNANALWNYFNSVISWIETTFIVYRPTLMKGLDYGYLYNNFGSKPDFIIDTQELEARIKALIEDDETITATKGIYYYVFDNDVSHISVRQFDKTTKLQILEKQNYKCVKCGKEITMETSHADHITPFAKGGRTIKENCQVLCEDCNRRKSDI